MMTRLPTTDGIDESSWTRYNNEYAKIRGAVALWINRKYSPLLQTRNFMYSPATRRDSMFPKWLDFLSFLYYSVSFLLLSLSLLTRNRPIVAPLKIEDIVARKVNRSIVYGNFLHRIITIFPTTWNS